MSSFRVWLGKLIAGKPINNKAHKFTDEDQEKNLAMRRQATALKFAEKQMEFMERLSKLEYSGGTKESAMDQVVSQVLPVLLQKMANEKAVAPIKPVNKNELPIPPLNIDELIKENPTLVENAKNFNDEEVSTYLLKQMPSLTSEQVKEIITKIRK